MLWTECAVFQKFFHSRLNSIGLLLVTLTTCVCVRLGLQYIDRVPSEGYLLDAGNFFNTTFVNHGFDLFVFLFLGTTFLQMETKTDPQFQLPGAYPVEEHDPLSKRALLEVNMIKLCVLTIVSVLLNVWFFGDAIFLRVWQASGGQCSIDHLKYSECLAAGGTFSGGFKISGHVYILTVMSAVICFEVTSFVLQGGQESDLVVINESDLLTRICQTVKLYQEPFIRILCIILVMWLFMFSVTGLFFHTVMEKYAAFCISVAFLYLVYCVDHIYREKVKRRIGS